MYSTNSMTKYGSQKAKKALADIYLERELDRRNTGVWLNGLLEMYSILLVRRCIGRYLVVTQHLAPGEKSRRVQASC